MLIQNFEVFNERANISRASKYKLEYKVLKEFKSGIEECQIKWTQLENKDLKTLDDWSNTVFDAIKKRVNKLKQVRKFQRRRREKILDREDVKRYLEKFQKDFVLVPTDKASNNISIVCKRFYILTLLKEVGFFDLDIGHIKK